MSLTATRDRSEDRAIPLTVKPREPVSGMPSFRVIRRNASVSTFDSAKIAIAMTKAFPAVEGSSAAASRRVHEIVRELTDQVTAALTRRSDGDRAMPIEEIQDQVELALMRGGHHKVARAYVLYREERARLRDATKEASPPAPLLHILAPTGARRPLDEARLAHLIAAACAGLAGVEAHAILTETKRNLYDGMSEDELALAQIMAARTLIETEPNYAHVSARLLLNKLRAEALSFISGHADEADQAQMAERYPSYFAD